VPRNSKGWLKADALRQGIPDQWARDVDGKRHVVQIISQDGAFVTEHKITPLEEGEVAGDWEIHRWECGTNLPQARGYFNAIVRSFAA
jgi:hypothetical protein